MKKESVAYEIRGLMISIKRYMEKATAYQEPKLHGIQVGTLLYLLENQDHDMFQKDIEEEFHIRRPTATNLMKRMEANGLIYREAVDYDARLKRIVLTDKAFEYKLWMEKATQQFQKQLTKGIPESELEQFISTLNKIRQNVEEE